MLKKGCFVYMTPTNLREALMVIKLHRKGMDIILNKDDIAKIKKAFKKAGYSKVSTSPVVINLHITSNGGSSSSGVVDGGGRHIPNYGSEEYDAMNHG